MDRIALVGGNGGPMEIAVIIPLYNGGPWIDQTLSAVFAQTHLPAEVIVVDDGSTDDSISRVQRDSRVTLLRNPGKLAARARNFGASHTRSPLIAFLDQDDLWHPEHLQRLIAALDGQPSAVAALAPCRMFHENQPPLFPETSCVHTKPFDVWEAFPFTRIVTPSVAVLRRSAFLKAGCWNADARYVADVELWLRMAMLGEFLITDAPTVGRRLHDESFSGSLRTDQLEAYLASLSRRATILAEERSSQLPRELGQLEGRVQLASCFHEIATALVHSERENMLRHLARLRRIMSDESDSFQSDIWQTLVWFLAPPNASSARRTNLTLVQHQLPPEHPFVRELSQQMLNWPASFWTRFYARRPWQRWRHQLLCAALRHRRESKLIWEGLDADGWAANRCHFRVSCRKGADAVQLKIEVPEWSGLEQQSITLVSGEHRQCAQLACGTHELTWDMSHCGEELLVEMESDQHFKLPHQHRRRSFRLIEAQVRPPHTWYRRSFADRRQRSTFKLGPTNTPQRIVSKNQDS